MGIVVKHLSKSFDYYKKELGLKNSIRNLFHREKLVKSAVRDISFEVADGEIVGFLAGMMRWDKRRGTLRGILTTPYRRRVSENALLALYYAARSTSSQASAGSSAIAARSISRNSPPSPLPSAESVRRSAARACSES